jgi:hypothetical protein
VQFRLDGANIGSPVTTAPWQISHDTRVVQNGPHTYGALITDRVGNQATITEAVTMENAPTVVMTNPTGGNVSGAITLSANVGTYDPSISVQFKVDGVNVGAPVTHAPFQVAYDTHLSSAGGHTFSAVATDGQSNSTTGSAVANVNNSSPAAGYVSLGDLMVNDGGYQDYRYGPEPYDGSGGDWIWSNTGAKIGYVYFPGNPDPTHYQMRAWFAMQPGCRIEYGDSGNIVYLDMVINGNWYNQVWAQGGPQFALLQNINGGESIGAKRWCTIPGMNNCFCQGVGGYYDFVPKGPYQS